jgi:hypothetical protein
MEEGWGGLSSFQHCTVLAAPAATIQSSLPRLPPSTDENSMSSSRTSHSIISVRTRQTVFPCLISLSRNARSRDHRHSATCKSTFSFVYSPSSGPRDFSFFDHLRCAEEKQTGLPFHVVVRLSAPSKASCADERPPARAHLLTQVHFVIFCPTQNLSSADRRAHRWTEVALPASCVLTLTM